MTLRKRLFATGFLLPLLGPVALRAQQFPTEDANLKRIWRLGMDSSQVRTLAQTLFDSIGPRLTGSPGIQATSNWIVAMPAAVASEPESLRGAMIGIAAIRLMLNRRTAA